MLLLGVVLSPNRALPLHTHTVTEQNGVEDALCCWPTTRVYTDGFMAWREELKAPADSGSTVVSLVG